MVSPICILPLAASDLTSSPLTPAGVERIRPMTARKDLTVCAGMLIVHEVIVGIIHMAGPWTGHDSEIESLQEREQV